jgi:hypothetical protein
MWDDFIYLMLGLFLGSLPLFGLVWIYWILKKRGKSYGGI